MAATYLDSTQAMLAHLQTSSTASAIRALVHGGVTAVLEAGDVTPEFLTDQETARRTANNLAKALCISVQDGGERPHAHHDKVVQTVIVRIYDRMRGYTNIREVRDEILKLWRRQTTLTLTSGKKRGALIIEYAGRTGHLIDATFAIEYEAITYSVIVTQED